MCLLILNISCISNKINNEFVEINFIKGGVSYPISINCNAFGDEGFKEIKQTKIITEKLFISKFTKLLKNLKPSNSNIDLDTKIQVITHFEDRTDTICMGVFQGIIMNGTVMNDEPELLRLVQKEISKE